MGRRSRYREQKGIPIRGPSVSSDRQREIVHRLQSRLINRTACCICQDTCTNLVNACRDGGHQHPDKICKSCRDQISRCPFCRERYEENNSDTDSDFDDMPPLIEGDSDIFSFDSLDMSSLIEGDTNSSLNELVDDFRFILGDLSDYRMYTTRFNPNLDRYVY